jgi:hypothetical protein
VAALEEAADLAQRHAVAEVRKRFPNDGPERDRAEPMLVALSRLHLDCTSTI